MSIFSLPRSIRGKIISSLLCIYFLGSAAAVVALFALPFMESKVRLIESFDTLNQTLLEIRRFEKNHLLYGNVEDLLHALDYLDRLRSSLALLEGQHAYSLTTVAEKLPLVHRSLDAYTKWLNTLRQTGARDRAQAENALRLHGQNLTETILLIDKLAKGEAQEKTNLILFTVLVILVASLVFGGIFSIFLIRWILEPLDYIRQAIRRIAKGELQQIPEEPVREKCTECSVLIASLNGLFAILDTKQKQLVQSAKLAAIGRVTAGIAHEINNPLNNISLTAEVLLEDLPGMECPERLDMVNDIVVQADRAREVVRHLLDFSRTRKPSAWERVDMVQLLKGTRLLLKNQLRIDKITVQEELPAGPVYVSGNPNQLQQVMVNFFLNAVQAMGPGGTLSVRLLADNGRAVTTIGDTGPGIPESIRNRIFEPFFTTKNDGTGLGLSVSQSIIREHRGDISVSSRDNEAGTLFTIDLPLDTAGATAP